MQTSAFNLTPRKRGAVKWSSGLRMPSLVVAPSALDGRMPSLAQKLHDLQKKLSRKMAVEKPEKSVESRKVVFRPSDALPGPKVARLAKQVEP